jgi:hypothetical protein
LPRRSDSFDFDEAAVEVELGPEALVANRFAVFLERHTKAEELAEPRAFDATPVVFHYDVESVAREGIDCEADLCGPGVPRIADSFTQDAARVPLLTDHL